MSVDDYKYEIQALNKELEKLHKIIDKLEKENDDLKTNLLDQRMYYERLLSGGSH